MVFPLIPKQFSPGRVSHWLAGGLALVLAAVCAATVAAWALRLLVHPRPVPAGAARAERLDVDALAALAPRAFQAVAQPARDQHLRLLGVIGGGARAGAALISIDGKPARAVAVGAEASPGVRLESTGFDHAALRRDGARIELKLAPPPREAGLAGPGSVQPPLSLPFPLPPAVPGPQP